MEVLNKARDVLLRHAAASSATAVVLDDAERLGIPLLDVLDLMGSLYGDFDDYDDYDEVIDEAPEFGEKRLCAATPETLFSTTTHEIVEALLRSRCVDDVERLLAKTTRHHRYDVQAHVRHREQRNADDRFVAAVKRSAPLDGLLSSIIGAIERWHGAAIVDAYDADAIAASRWIELPLVREMLRPRVSFSATVGRWLDTEAKERFCAHVERVFAVTFDGVKKAEDALENLRRLDAAVGVEMGSWVYAKVMRLVWPELPARAVLASLRQLGLDANLGVLLLIEYEKVPLDDVVRQTMEAGFDVGQTLAGLRANGTSRDVSTR